ncbi:MAG: glycosyltransferase family 39 protein [Chloroflexota bacterium]
MLALPLILSGYLALWPLADRLLRRESSDSSPLLVGLTALSLSLGWLSLGMFWLGMLPGRWLVGPAVLGIVALGWAVGLVLNWKWVAPRRWWAYWREGWARLWRFDLESLLAWTILGSLLVIAIHALYYPFLGDDTLSRYGLQAQLIYRAGHIPPAVSGYPPLAPLTFVATWLAAGQANEHLAKILPVVMAAATLGATYLLGRRLSGRQAGLIAAALVAVTPLFVRNATLAYTDIPTTFPLTLAVLYVLRWWDSGRARDAALAGVLIGIALFTKQSALTWLASLAVVPFVWLLATRHQPLAGRWRRMLSGLAGIILPALLIAGPWYARNALLDGWPNVLPIAGLYHLRSEMAGWRGLLPSLGWPDDFGPVLPLFYVSGWIVGLFGAGRLGWRSLQGQESGPPADLILAIVAVPYWLAWWLRFSFEARFLLLILPLLAVWAARLIEWAADRLGERVHLPRLLWQIGGGALLAGLLFLGVRARLGGVYEFITHPFASDDERLLHARGRLYDLVLYIRSTLDPSRDRIVLMDGRLAYYLLEYDPVVMYPQRLSDLEGFDYLVHSSSIFAVYNDRLGLRDSEFYQHVFDPLIFEPVYVSDGVHVMRILRTDIPSPAEYEASRAAERDK